MTSSLPCSMSCTTLDPPLMATSGGKQAIFNAAVTLINPGDDVLIPKPYWVTFPEIVTFAGGRSVFIETEENEFVLTADMVRAAITPRTKLIILNSPSNPSGRVIPPDEFEKIMEVVSERGIYVVSDECYLRFVYAPARVFSAASLRPELRQHLCIAGSFSKTYAMTGWRIGYAVAAEPWMTGLSKATLYSSNGVSTPTQWAALAAFTTSSDFLAASRAAYRERRDLLLAGLNEIGLTCTSPAGAFYAFPDVASISGDSREAANVLLDRAQVATVPGIVFGPHGEGHVRFSFSTSIETIKAGLESMRCNL